MEPHYVEVNVKHTWALLKQVFRELHDFAGINSALILLPSFTSPSGLQPSIIIKRPLCLPTAPYQHQGHQAVHTIQQPSRGPRVVLRHKMAVQIQQSRLLNLPAELRLEIYEYALDDPQEQRIECWLEASEIYLYRRRNFPLPEYRFPALAQTCKQLHNEVFHWVRSRRQVLDFMVDYLSEQEPPARYLEIDSFKVPEYCCGHKVDMDIYLEDPQAMFRKVFGDLTAVARKLRMIKFGNFKIATAHGINEENMCALLRGFATMCVSFGQPDSILVEEVEETGHIWYKQERRMSDFIAVTQTVKRCEYEC